MAIADRKLFHSIHQLDVAAFLKVANLNSRENVARFARGVSRSADGWMYPLIPLIAALFSPAKALPLFYTLALAYGVERALYFALKKSIKRSRPPVAIPGFKSLIHASDEFSFPSGHTSAAFLAVTTLVLFFPTAGLQLLFIWSAMVAASRVVVGVHFPLDTVAGAILGSTTAFVTYLYMT